MQVRKLFKGGNCSRAETIWGNTVFWEGHKSLRNLQPLLLTVCTVVKSKGKISQKFLAFSEYMNFTRATQEYSAVRTKNELSLKVLLKNSLQHTTWIKREDKWLKEWSYSIEKLFSMAAKKCTLMVICVVNFSSEGYNIKKISASKSTSA